MSYLTDEKFDNRTRAQKLLEELKNKEKKFKFHERKIGKNTVIFCKNEERLEEYDNNYNNIKNW